MRNILRCLPLLWPPYLPAYSSPVLRGIQYRPVHRPRLLSISPICRSACPGPVPRTAVPAYLLLPPVLATYAPNGSPFRLILYSLMTGLQILRLHDPGTAVPWLRTGLLPWLLSDRRLCSARNPARRTAPMGSAFPVSLPGFQARLPPILTAP